MAERGGELGLEGGLPVGDLVEGLLDLPPEFTGDLELGECGLQFAGLRVERRGIGRGLGRLRQRGEGLLGARQFDLRRFGVVGELGEPRHGGPGLLL